MSTRRIKTNPFLRGSCFVTHEHYTCKGIGYRWPVGFRTARDGEVTVLWVNQTFK